MNLNPIKAAVAPYMMWIKLGLIVAVCLGLVNGGCRWQRTLDQNEITQKNAALQAASSQLAAAAHALRAQNKAAADAIAAEKAAKADAETAGKAAARQAEQQKKKASEFERLYNDAKRKPRCEAILKMDLKKECGI